MTEVNGSAPTVEGLVLVESGRYKLWQEPNGYPAIARATGLCERCQSCGCGDQQPLVTMAGMMQMALQNGFSLGSLKGMFKAARGK